MKEAGIHLPTQKSTASEDKEEKPEPKAKAKAKGKSKANKDDTDNANKDNEDAKVEPAAEPAATTVEPAAAARVETIDDQHSQAYQLQLQGFKVSTHVTCKDSATVETWRNVACSVTC